MGHQLNRNGAKFFKRAGELAFSLSDNGLPTTV